MISASRSPLEQELRQAISNRQGPFERDVATFEDVRGFLRSLDIRASVGQLTAALRSVGGVSLGQQRIGGTRAFQQGGSTYFLRNTTARGTLWAFFNPETWEMADPRERAAEYSKETDLN